METHHPEGPQKHLDHLESVPVPNQSDPTDAALLTSLTFIMRETSVFTPSFGPNTPPEVYKPLTDQLSRQAPFSMKDDFERWCLRYRGADRHQLPSRPIRRQADIPALYWPVPFPLPSRVKVLPFCRRMEDLTTQWYNFPEALINIVSSWSVGTPAFQNEELFTRHGIHVYSSNYAL